ncbi:MAG: DUF3786 domain-containing protein [Desulfohalobiaceae bacterium]
MTQPSNPMQIYSLLEKSDCRQCGEPTCLAFAAAVFRGQRSLDECPRLDPEVARQYAGQESKRSGPEEDMYRAMQELQQKVPELDFEEAARRTGGRLDRDRITVKVMGKDFSVDKQGRLMAEIHTNPWVGMPVLNYILHGKGLEPKGKWLPFRELPGGRVRSGLFEQRCEKPLKKIADEYTDLFQDMLDIFNAQQVDEQYQADISILLYPLPKVPMLVCYWQADEGLESSLHIFFDETAPDNVGIDGVFSIGSGLAQMFEKLARRHAGR